MTIHYHGNPIWGGSEVLKAAYQGGGCLVSFHRIDQIWQVANLKNTKLVLDNGAFAVWKGSKLRGRVFTTWEDYWEMYYDFVGKWFSRIEWFIIPDVIEGTEEENDRRIEECPKWLLSKAVPVWHSNESLDRLVRLAGRFDRVAIGCCGDERSIRSPAWRKRMTEAFDELYVKRNLKVKIHGLRMLDGRALSQYPFDSADSTTVASSTSKTQTFIPEVTDKVHRAAILRGAIEKVLPPTVDDYRKKRLKELTNGGKIQEGSVRKPKRATKRLPKQVEPDSCSTHAG